MRYELLQKNLLDAIEDQTPKGNNTVNTLVKILSIGKEAVYRRLRGEVPFTLYETVLIAKKLNISLDNTLGALSNQNRPFQLKLTEYINPSELDFEMMEQFINVLKSANDEPFSEMGNAENTLPQVLYLNHPYLSKYFLFKWMNQYYGPNSDHTYDKMLISDRLLKIQKEALKELKNIKYTYYVWDDMIFTYLINDIKYFTNIKLISPENKQKIKEDIINFIEELEIYAAKGCFDNGNKLELYISHINLESSYSYIHSQNCNINLIKIFTLNSIASLDIETFNKLKKWIESLKRSSTLISESGEIQRIRFFKKQREIINTL